MNCRLESKLDVNEPELSNSRPRQILQNNSHLPFIIFFNFPTSLSRHHNLFIPVGVKVQMLKADFARRVDTIWVSLTDHYLCIRSRQSREYCYSSSFFSVSLHFSIPRPPLTLSLLGGGCLFFSFYSKDYGVLSACLPPPPSNVPHWERSASLS